jgi:hypothetical protein
VLVVCVILAYFLALNPGILGRNNDYLVMSSVNWQDTALHISITQSLTQGNFPPMAPYYSGVPLTYYYFSDLHSAILAIMYGQFFPRVFVYDNAILAGVLALTIYSLAFEISGMKKLSLISAFMGSFYGSFIFIEFLREVVGGANIIQLLTSNTYSMEYQKLFGVANMADYYMQNRPMMIGLPIVIIALALIIYAFRNKNLLLIVFAGILSASLVKFQFFCVLAGAISVFIIGLCFFRKGNFKFTVASVFLFLLPIPIFYLVFGTKSVNGLSFFDLVKNTFHFGPWDNMVHSPSWYLYFLPLNLGLPFLVVLLCPILDRKKEVVVKIISILSLIFIAIPCFVTFTIAEGDMLKFFYFAEVLFVIIAPIYLWRVFKNKILFGVLMAVVIFTTTFSSFLTLTNSYLNKNFGYSLSDYNAGVWIRNNTPEKSVFVTMPTLHSAPSDFGGRLRVLSYINWPYSHGYNLGTDNVFSRSEDIESLYGTGNISLIKLKYHVKYIYYGEEEKSKYPLIEAVFDNSRELVKVYDREGIKIYNIIQ